MFSDEFQKHRYKSIYPIINEEHLVLPQEKSNAILLSENMALNKLLFVALEIYKYLHKTTSMHHMISTLLTNELFVVVTNVVCFCLDVDSVGALEADWKDMVDY